MGVLMGGFAPQCRKMVFISRRLNFRAGGENISKINSFRIIGQSITKNFLCFKISQRRLRI